MFKLFELWIDARKIYLGENLKRGNVLSNLSRCKKLYARINKHRAFQKMCRLAFKAIRNKNSC
jgi:hypothetical protein